MGTMMRGMLCAAFLISHFSFLICPATAQGLLTDRYLNGIPSDSRMAREHFLKKEALTPQLLEYLQQLKAEGERRGESIAQQALRWVLDQKGVTSVLVGASSTAQLETNLAVI